MNVMPTLLESVREVWQARELTREFVRRDLAIRYAQTVMGFAWALLMPILVVCSGLIFRLVISNISGNPITSRDVGGIAIKSLPWVFFASAISMSTQSLVSHANLIGKVYFPRETLPLATVLGQSVDTMIGSIATILLLLALGLTPGLQSLWFVGLMALFATFTLGCALLLSCANLFYRDVKYLVQVLLNFGIFATPVLVDVQTLGLRASKIMLALPLSPFIQGAQISVVNNRSLLSTVVESTARGDVVVWAPWMLWYAVVLTAALLSVGLTVFRAGAGRFAEVA